MTFGIFNSCRHVKVVSDFTCFFIFVVVIRNYISIIIRSASDIVISAYSTFVCRCISVTFIIAQGDFIITCTAKYHRRRYVSIRIYKFFITFCSEFIFLCLYYCLLLCNCCICCGNFSFLTFYIFLTGSNSCIILNKFCFISC